MRGERKELWTEQPIGPWRAKVSVIAVSGSESRQTSLPFETLFEVLAEWTGPPAPGFPPSDRPVQAQSAVLVKTHDAAMRIARTAADVLRAPRVPDMRVLAGEHSIASVSPARLYIP